MKKNATASQQQNEESLPKRQKILSAGEDTEKTEHTFIQHSLWNRP